MTGEPCELKDLTVILGYANTRNQKVPQKGEGKADTHCVVWVGHENHQAGNNRAH